MSSSINKENLEHLAQLARVRLTAEEEARFLADLKNILDHFEELKTVDTEGVEPMNGGTRLQNIFREDDVRHDTNRGAGTTAFPTTQNGYLVVPPVFDQE